MRFLFWITALVVLLAVCDFGHAFLLWRSFTSCESGTTPSSLTFAYSNLRTGSTRSCLSSNSFSGFDVNKVTLPFTPTPAMLLYRDGQNKTGPHQGRRVIFGQSYPAGIYAYDIDEKRVLWRHDFFSEKPGSKLTMPINSSAPVIDEKTWRIYGTFIEEKFVGNKPTDSRLTQHYYSIGISGEDPEKITIDLSRFLLGAGAQATPSDISKYVRCRTALGVNRESESPYVYSGCSIVRAFSFQGSNFVHKESSQTVKGIRGMLLTLPIDVRTGRFEGGAKAFIPAKMGTHAGAGVDAGIWLSGGAPTLLPGNRILLATGNGVYRPDLEIYGCSVLSLNGDSLEVNGSYFSAKGEDVEKASASCHKGNLDPSSSAITVQFENGKYKAAIGGKDGWIKAFDPAKLPGANADPSHEMKVVDGMLFGQPIAFPGSLFAIGGNGDKGIVWSGFSVKDDFKIDRLWNVSDSHPRAFNSSATGTYRGKGEHPLLLVPLASGTPAEGFPASLQAVDARTGAVLGETPFHGAAHFSMPTVVDDRVFVPTAEHGIYEFTAKRNLRDFLIFHSLIGRIFL